MKSAMSSTLPINMSQTYGSISNSLAPTAEGTDETAHPNSKENRERDEASTPPKRKGTRGDKDKNSPRISSIYLQSEDPRSSESVGESLQMNFTSIRNVMIIVRKNRRMHILSWMHLSRRQLCLFTLPEAILTTVASILAFLVSSELLPDDNHKAILSVIVGSTTGVVVFLQTMAAFCDYGTRAAMHQGTANDLEDLQNDLEILMLKTGQIMSNDFHKLVQDDMTYGEAIQRVQATNTDALKYSQSFETIQNRLTHSMSTCKSNIPMEIAAAFEGLQTGFSMTMTKETAEHYKKAYGTKEAFYILHDRAFDILQGEIIATRFFPMRLPDPQTMVKNSLDKLKCQFSEYRFHVADPNFQYTNDATKDEENQN
ncbi:unnamed protein product [Pseudo-nitzschia multistriata]|uniref:Uncharacterized protein n=1 Tax=Pseudo-nitzschia multistriata TaxID=183589 RepID=A0A448ZQA0_9STRA|nr:unnamed protein product [Pseudo-nitzschia multistriata]